MSTREPVRKTRKKIRYALLVLGMHRSGTSALAGVLTRLGATAPRKLMDANEHNARGYWESTELMRVHDALLRSAGTRWNDWGRFNPDWIESPVSSEFEEKLADAIQAEFKDSPLFVAKDPRISRFLPVWLRVLEQLKVVPKILIPIRHPIEVARSLEIRNHFGRNKSLLLWLRHVLDAEFSSRNLDRTFLQYDNLLNDWRGEIKRFSTELGVKWPKWSDDVEMSISDFLSSDLKHNVTATKTVATAGELDAWVDETYHLLTTFAAGRRQDTAALERLDAIRGQLDETSDVYGAVVREHENRVEALYADIKSKLAKEGERAERLQAELDQTRGLSEAGSVDLRQAMAELEAVSKDRADIQERLTRRDREYEELSASVNERVEEIAGLQERLARRDRDCEELSALKEGLGKEVERLKTSLAQANASVKERFDEIAQLTALVLEIESKATEREATHETKLTTASREIAGLQERLARRDREHEELAARLTAASEEVSGLRERLMLAQYRVAASTASIKRLDSGARQLRTYAASCMQTLQAIQSNVIWKATGPLHPRIFVTPVPDVALDDEVITHQAELLEKSGMFDRRWYTAQNLRGDAGGLDAIEHYLREGAASGLNPSPDFDTVGYLSRYEDVRHAGVNPLVHYVEFGAREGRLAAPGGAS